MSITIDQGGELKASLDILKQMAPGVDQEDVCKLLPLKVAVELEGENIVKVYQQCCWKYRVSFRLCHCKVFKKFTDVWI